MWANKWNLQFECAIWGGIENVPQCYKDKFDTEQYYIDIEQLRENDFEGKMKGGILYE